jgi:hypothetical protein
MNRRGVTGQTKRLPTRGFPVARRATDPLLSRNDQSPACHPANPALMVALDSALRRESPLVRTRIAARTEIVWALALGIIVPLLFATYTRHVWEDWYITFRASKNLALGLGLVFTPGERTHSFTSPLGTLIPALLSYFSGNTADGLVIWLFRAIGALLHGAAAVLLVRIARTIGLPGWCRICLFGLFIFDAKINDFSINGMETAFLVWFLMLMLYAHLVPTSRQGVLLGLAWAGLMWTRPDGFVPIVALGLAFLLFRPGRSANRPRSWIPREYIVGLTICAALYLPWLVWAWSYYGSFVPHTVTAKGLANGSPATAWHLLLWVLLFPTRVIQDNSAFADVFMPTYYGFGGWPIALDVVSRLLGWAAAFAWMAPRLRPDTRALSLALCGMCFYLQSLPMRFPWYVPPATVLAILVISLLLWQFAEAIVPGNTHVRAKLLVGYSVPVLTLLLTCATAYQLRYQQALIEDGNRRQIGLWLKANANPTDTVFLEPLGYIGFFSQLKMLDFPGLASAEVVAARRQLHSDSFALLIERLQPDWVVLRSSEIVRIDRERPLLLRQGYAPAQVFDVSAQVNAVPFLPGRPYLMFDQTFTVFHRQARAAAQDATGS